MKSYIFYFLFAVSSVGLFSCNDRQTQPVKATSAIPDTLVKNIQTAPAVTEFERDVIKLNGKIQANESRQAKVFALVSGRIQYTHAELGDFVRKGQVLAELKSIEVAGMSNDISLAESNVQMAKKNLETTTDLYKGSLATEQDWLNAKIGYNKALSEFNRARQVASITGGKNASYTISAPISGFIIEKNVTANSEVRQDNNTDLFAIADLSEVWIMANVYEADMNSIHLGDPVTVNTLANPTKDYPGRIDKIYNVLDPATRTMKVRISMNNPGYQLKPEMFASVKVNGRVATQVLSIPSQAIIMDNSRNYVVLRRADKLSIREITLIKRVDDRAYIAGLAVGDQVVTNSQVFLYQALSTN